ncbi:hypothetical protein NM688_g4288 [Phlebia brevispora]|uniref:Uncharacterized protein n=1 Tax=Phlebia brevispora TaxID=194682 RepID=A0ACC1T3H7_9APHY|nr:hypothetical protein NM688_g4288 [Phlebia brevispora]
MRNAVDVCARTECFDLTKTGLTRPSQADDTENGQETERLLRPNMEPEKANLASGPDLASAEARDRA